eukprot:3471730-Karenia_brevis.AAC.1
MMMMMMVMMLMMMTMMMMMPCSSEAGTVDMSWRLYLGVGSRAGLLMGLAAGTKGPWGLTH